jgi:hypothetical protein
VADEQDDDDGEPSRLDRELIELLNELRVALPGVQVLFAFLLTIPFAPRFTELSDRDVDVYVFALVASAIAAMLLIAPAAHHRLTFRQHAKERLLRLANLLVLGGTVSLAVAVGAAVYLVASMVYTSRSAAWIAGVLSAVTAVLWFVVPVVALRRERRADDDRGPASIRGQGLPIVPE